MLRQVLHEKLQTGAFFGCEALIAFTAHTKLCAGHSGGSTCLHWDLLMRKYTTSCGSKGQTSSGPPTGPKRRHVSMLLPQHRVVPPPLHHSKPKWLRWMHHWRLLLRQGRLHVAAMQMPVCRKRCAIPLGSKRLKRRCLRIRVRLGLMGTGKLRQSIQRRSA